MWSRIACRGLILVSILAASPAVAGPADVLDVRVETTAPGLYRFDVTVRHDDSGWEHYADRWDILGPGGDTLATRVLAHPHVGEQPFTRSLAGVRIPDGVDRVTVRAHDSVHGNGGRTLMVTIPR